MIFSKSIIITGFLSSTFGLSGYQMYKHWKSKNEYLELDKIFETYDLYNYITEYNDNRP